jgi:hypothetical protein
MQRQMKRIADNLAHNLAQLCRSPVERYDLRPYPIVSRLMDISSVNFALLLRKVQILSAQDSAFYFKSICYTLSRRGRDA